MYAMKRNQNHIDIQIEKPFIIIGVGRSGTTLLQAMLNAHPDICLPPESHFIRDFIANSYIQRIYNQKGLNEVERILAENKYVQRLKINTEEALMPFRENNEEFICGTLFKRYLYLYAKRKNKRYIGEKDPSNTYYLSEIKNLFARPRIIHIIRDPRDVVLSRLNPELAHGLSMEDWAFNYSVGLRIARKNGTKMFGSHYHEIYYEDLVTDTETTLKTLCDKLGISFETQMLFYHNKASEIVSDDEEKWKKNVDKPIMKNNVDKWKSKLSNKQIKMIEIICRKVFKTTKYEKRNNPNSFSLLRLRFILLYFRHKLQRAITLIKSIRRLS